jgi:hypothetical protein
MCVFFSSCRSGDLCRFVHEKKIPCKYFLKTNGKCRRGDLCPFAHLTADQIEDAAKEKACLLSKLLSPDTDRYHLAALQCLRFITSKNYFGAVDDEEKVAEEAADDDDDDGDDDVNFSSDDEDDG